MLNVGDKKRVAHATCWVYQVHADGSHNCAPGADLAKMLGDSLKREEALQAELSNLKRPRQATHNGEPLR